MYLTLLARMTQISVTTRASIAVISLAYSAVKNIRGLLALLILAKLSPTVLDITWNPLRIFSLPS